ncbi:type II 3-dehydroquinate dehydratase [Bradyrhizobium sp. ORS 285]|nr:type II 3-dehydroquinate dehydratase [Bradyrhizobium sp. ORS 285]
MAEDANKTIYVLHGPSTDLSGTCEPQTSGLTTLADVERLCADTAARFGLTSQCRRSDHEEGLVQSIHEARARAVAGIVLNTGTYSRTSVALHDVLVRSNIPMVAVRIGNTCGRDSFRHHTFTAKAAFASISGFGVDGYRLAITGLAAKLGAKAAPQTDLSAQA